ncbi:Rpn family recombination-promoting nuclease/putative transposase [Lysinibacillus louembei]|uniref:Rpn family recombination-promoting nuclease/putative transposase n=1 Tax=Lysinibacillus louembei TaxID=1470088 RepID=A0ABZ0S0L9_9BACI|nr:Rpn family recombination-promoting nuclease/putative transposase [Lysinibacillus louembei]WPK12573.1 Rpn family recombination-promoting nuclease/putative transposase [Lysinibacillus louembei]
MKLQNPHDKFFKETFGNVEVTKDFIQYYLPEAIRQVIDMNTLEPQKDSFLNPKLEENFSDLLFKVAINQQEGYLYILFEHKSYLDKDTAVQLLKYMVEIWEAKRNKERVQELPIVIPLVIYHGKKEWTLPTNLSAQLNGYDNLPSAIQIYVPSFEYVLCDLSRYQDGDIQGSVITRIVIMLLRDVQTKEGTELINSIANAFHHLQELNNKTSVVGYVETLLRYVFEAGRKLTQADMKSIIKQLETNEMKGEEFTMTLAEMWKEIGERQGEQKGLEKGLEKGRSEALVDVALLQLTSKFGKLPDEIKEALTKADQPALQLILANIFTVEHLDQVKRYLL